MRPALNLSPGKALPALLLTLVLTACQSYPPPIEQSEGHLAREKASTAASDAPPPVTGPGFVPEPKAKPKIPTYSVVVHEVPVKELLLALARDTKENIDIHPGLTGLVSLNAIDEPLPAILDRVSRQVDMRYRVEGRTIIVSPDTPYMKSYQVNYVNMSRDTTSTVAVTGQISSGSTGAGGSSGSSNTGSSSGGGQGGTSTTSVSSQGKNDFWVLIRDNIQSILKSTTKLAQSADAKQAQAEAMRAAREELLEIAKSVGGDASKIAARTTGADSREDLSYVVVNPVTGAVIVLATDKQHSLVQEYLTGVTGASQRQVLIEATIAEVKLSNTYQAGVDWDRMFRAAGDGFRITQSLASTPGAAGALSIFYKNDPANATVSSTIRLLEQFGDIKVLSSPKLMALNNQTALLKVVDNLVYFTFEREITLATATTPRTDLITSEINTVAVGVSMSVTPQVNENGVVTLIVRPTISSVIEFVDDPNPNLRFDASGDELDNPIPNRIPVVTVREMESVLQLTSGQVAVLGGLMQDNISKNKKGVPGLSRIRGVGEVFSQRDETTTKSELVIFLKPTVVTNPSLDSDELRSFRRFMPQLEKTGSKP